MAGTPIYDEIHKFMESVKAHTPAIEDALQKMGKAFEGWPVYIDWGQQYGKNQYMMGTEAANQAWFAAERKNQERKDRLKKERENCLHGRAPFRITMAHGFKCPACGEDAVYRGEEKMFCFLCDWSRSRIGKRF